MASYRQVRMASNDAGFCPILIAVASCRQVKELRRWQRLS